MRLIDADAFEEFIEKVYRPLCDDYHMKDYVLNQLLHDIENEKTVDAIPIEFIEKYAQLSDDAVALFGVPVGVLKNVYRSLIDEWKKENEETI